MERIGAVVTASGRVSAENESGVRELEAGSPVFGNDVLKTGADSRLEIKFADDTTLAQGPESSLSIDEYVYNGDPSASEMLLDMAKGTFRMVTGKIADENPEGVHLSSPLSTIGIRGTGVDMEVRPRGEKYGIFDYDKLDLVVSTAAGTQFITGGGMIMDVFQDGSFGQVRPYEAFEIAGFQAAAPITSVPGLQEYGEEPGENEDEDQDGDEDGDGENGEENGENGEGEAEAEGEDEGETEGEGPEANGELTGETAEDQVEGEENEQGEEGEPEGEPGPQSDLPPPVFGLVDLFSPSDSFGQEGSGTDSDNGDTQDDGQQASEPEASGGDEQPEQPETVTDDDDDIEEPFIPEDVPPEVAEYLRNLNWIYGTDSAETLMGTADNDGLVGKDGNDSLEGLDGEDAFIPGEGNDTCIGGAGNDHFLSSPGNDSFLGGADTGDHVVFDQDDTGTGVQVNLHSVDTMGITALTAIDQWGHTDDLDGIEQVDGSNYCDTIIGSVSDNTIAGMNGDDFIEALDGFDDVSGGSGDDTINGGTENDEISGYSGNDSLLGDSGQDSLWGGSGNDFVSGGGDNDEIGGDAGNDSLYGGTGHDTINGENGDDLLYGESGNDFLNGGAGNDTIDLGLADNFEDDVFYHALEEGGVSELIKNFEGSYDEIHVNINVLDSNWFTAGDHLNAGNFESTATAGDKDPSLGHACFLYNSADHILYYDADGAGGEEATALASFDDASSDDPTADDIFTVDPV
jgi:Ca2+-binding RTX toxin-like protein